MLMEQTTADRILDVAQELVQRRGYHAFSYRDISDQIGIKKSSIHYYYPSKTDLAKALLQRIRKGFEEALSAIDLNSPNAASKLVQFTEIFLETYGDDGRLCPFCMIATSQETIPESIHEEVRAFWSRGEIWVKTVLDEGVESGEFSLTESSVQISRLMIASLEGAMVVAKAFDDRSRLEDMAKLLMSLIQQKH